ncbi:cytochrome-c oxidase subunit VIIa [Suillus subluteus]|nr:cytochrome-c oxidase subunit VIIa [Suillus subluteus]
MPIAQITDKLRKRLWLDLSVHLGIGVSSAYAYWYVVHLESVQRQEVFYFKLDPEKLQQSQ